MKRFFKRILDVISLFALECKFKSMETDEARFCRLITEDIEHGFEINDKL